MSDNAAWIEHQRRRWLRPDWERWVRHDAHVFAPPVAQATSYATRLVEQRRAEEKQAAVAAEDAVREDIERLRWLVKDLTIDLAIHRLRLKYSPDQPRDERGRWTDSGQTTLANHEVETSSNKDGSEDDEQSPEELVILASDKPKGHHYVNRSLYRDLPLPPETRKVFDQATTGSLSPDVHRWSKEHADYNKAIKESFDKYLETRGIRPDTMTPGQARSFVEEVLKSPDPRIRDFNMRILLRQPFRVFRGNE